jgi:hypothetical protein
MKKLILTIGKYTIEVFYDEASTNMNITEARHRGIPIGGPYAAKYHKAHAPTGKDHLQFYKKQNKLFAMNVDGTGHDGSSGIELPNRIAKGINKVFPDVTLPPNNIIEKLKIADRILFLLNE